MPHPKYVIDASEVHARIANVPLQVQSRTMIGGYCAKLSLAQLKRCRKLGDNTCLMSVEEKSIDAGV